MGGSATYSATPGLQNMRPTKILCGGGTGKEAKGLSEHVRAPKFSYAQRTRKIRRKTRGIAYLDWGGARLLLLTKAGLSLVKEETCQCINSNR